MDTVSRNIMEMMKEDPTFLLNALRYHRPKCFLKLDLIHRLECIEDELLAVDVNATEEVDKIIEITNSIKTQIGHAIYIMYQGLKEFVDEKEEDEDE